MLVRVVGCCRLLWEGASRWPVGKGEDASTGTQQRAASSRRSLTACCQEENKPRATGSMVSRPTRNLYFYRCFPKFKCWQMIPIICPTLKANPNRSKGQIRGSGCQLVDLRSRPLQCLLVRTCHLFRQWENTPALATGLPSYCTASGH